MTTTTQLKAGIRAGWLSMIFLHIMDLVSTFMFMSKGYPEGNPIMAWMFDISFLFGSSIKMLIAIAMAMFTITLVSNIEHRGILKLHYWTAVVLFMVLHFVVFNNFLGVIWISLVA